VLIGAGARVGDRDADGATPLHCAAEGGHIHAALALVAAGAGLEAANGSGRTPLCLAGQNSHKQVALVLVGAMAAGLASDARNGVGLGSAAAQRNIGRTLALLGPDTDTLASASGGVPPLQLAAARDGCTAAEGTPQAAAKSNKNSRRHEEFRHAGRGPPCMCWCSAGISTMRASTCQGRAVQASALQASMQCRHHCNSGCC
jgi:ankyrin repeat protein